MKNNLTSEQKLDYIYKTLKNQKRFFWMKFIIKILLFVVFIYIIFIVIPNYNKDKLYKDISIKVGDLVTPIVENMIKNIELKGGTNIDNNIGLSDEVIKKLKENPEILDKLINK